MRVAEKKAARLGKTNIGDSCQPPAASTGYVTPRTNRAVRNSGAAYEAFRQPPIQREVWVILASFELSDFTLTLDGLRRAGK